MNQQTKQNIGSIVQRVSTLELAFVLTVLVFTASAWAGEVGTVKSNTSLWTDPELNAPRNGRVSRGDEGTVLEKNKRWVKLNLADGRTGWGACAFRQPA